MNSLLSYGSDDSGDEGYTMVSFWSIQWTSIDFYPHLNNI